VLIVLWQSGHALAGALGTRLVESLWLGNNVATAVQKAIADPLRVEEIVVVARGTRPDWAGKPWRDLPPSVYWTDRGLDLVRKYQRNPLRAARTLAYLNAGIHDAMTLCARNHLGPDAQLAAAHAAGALVLHYFFPDESFGRYEAVARAAFAALLQSDASQDALSRGWTIGRAVARETQRLAALDGAAAVWSVKNAPPRVPGGWRPSPPINSGNPTEPLAGAWRTWVLEKPDQITIPPPVRYDSEQYWTEVREVIDVARSLTARQKETAERWNLDLGTVTPAGVWNLKTRELVLEAKLPPARVAEVFATLNAAMHDAFVACWHVKFTYWTQRPGTAIRSRIDAAFLPHLLTPAFPSYPSGHATASGAAAEVLSHFFPEKAAMLQAQAEEASMSRLYGGIHFRSDNDQGFALGRRIGKRVIEARSAAPRLGRNCPISKSEIRLRSLRVRSGSGSPILEGRDDRPALRTSCQSFGKKRRASRRLRCNAIPLIRCRPSAIAPGHCVRPASFRPIREQHKPRRTRQAWWQPRSDPEPRNTQASQKPTPVLGADSTVLATGKRSPPFQCECPRELVLRGCGQRAKLGSGWRLSPPANYGPRVGRNKITFAEKGDGAALCGSGGQAWETNRAENQEAEQMLGGLAQFMPRRGRTARDCADMLAEQREREISNRKWLLILLCHKSCLPFM
jgi:hypothetical protein